jgi:hypothetical protein
MESMKKKRDLRDRLMEVFKEDPTQKARLAIELRITTSAIDKWFQDCRNIPFRNEKPVESLISNYWLRKTLDKQKRKNIR